MVRSFPDTKSAAVCLLFEWRLRAKRFSMSPVSKLFGGVHDEVRREVSERIDALGTRLEERKNHGRHKLLIQRKLAWIQERLHRVVFSIN